MRPNLTWETLQALYNHPETSVEVARGLLQASTTLKVDRLTLIEFLTKVGRRTAEPWEENAYELASEARKVLARHVLPQVSKELPWHPSRKDEKKRLTAEVTSLVEFYAEESNLLNSLLSKRDQATVHAFLERCYDDEDTRLVNLDRVELALFQMRHFAFIKERKMLRLVPHLCRLFHSSPPRPEILWEGWHTLGFADRRFHPDRNKELEKFRERTKTQSQMIDDDCLRILSGCGEVLQTPKRFVDWESEVAETLLALVACFQHLRRSRNPYWA